MKVWIDTETYSTVPIANGTGAYCAGVEVMLLTYAIDDGPVGLWDRTRFQPIPSDLNAALKNPRAELWAHNSFFDRSVLCARGNMRYGFDLSIPRWRCTMAQAYAHGLPGALGTLCEILGVEQEQSKQDGKQLIHLFCKPRPDGSRATRKTHPVEWDRFCAYATQDIVAMREVHRKLPKWNYPNNRDELELWFRDQEINDRGVLIDLELCKAAVRAADKAKREHARQTKEQTDGMVERATQRDKLLAFILLEHGIELPDMRADTLERRLLDDNVPAELKSLLSVRLESAMNSQTKYRKALRCVSPDGRARGLYQFDGAARTGRWAGRVLQPQNFPRPKLKQRAIEDGIRALKLGCEDLLCA